MRIASFMLALSVTSFAMAAEPTGQEINKKIVELMETTQVGMRDGLDVPAAEYKSDGDPKTLEIVLLKSKNDGPSRVSDDGEVIFLYKASDKKQQELITEAFTIRALRALHALGN